MSAKNGDLTPWCRCSHRESAHDGPPLFEGGGPSCTAIDNCCCRGMDAMGELAPGRIRIDDQDLSLLKWKGGGANVPAAGP